MFMISTAEFLSSISHHIEQGLLSRLRKSQFLTVMADTASKEEMSICARWIEGGKAEKSIDIQMLRGLGYDGASTMSGRV